MAHDPPDRDAAFRRYVLPELEVLLRVARRLTSDGAEAEDLVQETLIRAYRALDRFDGRHPRAWLLTILRNTRKNMLRTRRPTLEDEDALQQTPAHGADGRRGAEEQVLDSVLDADLARALEGLPARAQRVIILVDVEGLSYQEAADALGVPVGTVMSRLHRARRRLRDALQDADHLLRGRR